MQVIVIFGGLMKGIEFNQGIVYAAAVLIEMYDQPTMALSIINAAGLSHDDLKECSEYDLETLRKEDETIPKGI